MSQQESELVRAEVTFKECPWGNKKSLHAQFDQSCTSLIVWHNYNVPEFTMEKHVTLEKQITILWVVKTRAYIKF